MIEQRIDIDTQPRVGIATLASPLEVGAGDSETVLDQAIGLLSERGIPTVRLGTLGITFGNGKNAMAMSPDDISAIGRLAAAESIAAYLLISVSWFEDYLAIDLLEEWKAPVFLWPRPGMETGALCGAQQLAWFFKQLDVKYGYAFGALDSESCLKKALTFIQAASLLYELRRARIGIAGQRVDGMTHTGPDESALKRVLGPRVVPLELPSLLDAAAVVPTVTTDSLWENLKLRADRIGVSDATGHEVMAFHHALESRVDALGLRALTVGCYPSLMGKPCLSASLLADRGVPLSCEGDVNGAVGMLILSILSGGAVHSTDWLDPLPDDTVVFTHCGSGSLSLADPTGDVELQSVRLMDQGVCALFPGKTGPVTLVSLNAVEGGYQIACLEGEAVKADMVFPGNPVRVKFEIDVANIIDFIFREGIGHHWSIGYGHYEVVIREWAGMLPRGARYLSPTVSP